MVRTRNFVRRQASIVIALLLVAGTLGTGPAPVAPIAVAQAPTAPAASLRQIATAGLEKSTAPGMSVALVQNDAIAWSDGFGLADIENDLPVRADAVFRIASISKPMTATAVMQLVERGRVSIDDPMQKYVPAFPGKRRADHHDPTLC